MVQKNEKVQKESRPTLGWSDLPERITGFPEGTGTFESFGPGRFQFTIVRLDDRGFGDQNIGPRTVVADSIGKKGPEATFSPIAFDSVSHLFPGDKRHTAFRTFAEKEDEPGGMPDLVGALVDPVELTLLREVGKAV